MRCRSFSYWLNKLDAESCSAEDNFSAVILNCYNNWQMQIGNIMIGNIFCTWMFRFSARKSSSSVSVTYALKSRIICLEWWIERDLPLREDSFNGNICILFLVGQQLAQDYLSHNAPQSIQIYPK